MTLLIIRGIPGSGKSTLAKRLIDRRFIRGWFETDMYFMDINGEYKFDREKLGDARRFCERYTDRELQNKNSIVISNTFTRMCEIEPYIALAKKHNVPIMVIECKGNYRNVHEVPDETIQLMKEHWEPLPDTFKDLEWPEETKHYMESVLGIPIADTKLMS